MLLKKAIFHILKYRFFLFFNSWDLLGDTMNITSA